MSQRTLTISLVGFCLAMLLGAVVIWNSISQPFRLMQVHNDMKWLALALHHYHDQYQSLPPTVTLSPDGTPWRSWRSVIQSDMSAIVPDVRDHLDGYDETTVWNSPQNLRQQSRHRFGSHEYSFLAVTGPRTAWNLLTPGNFAAVPDGISQTILCVAVPGQPISWNEPADLTFDGTTLWRSDDPTQTPIDLYGCIVMLADGSIRYLGQPLPQSKQRELLNATDGQPTTDAP